MKLYQELGYNPMAGCLPTFIQFPIIIGLYQSITHALAASPLSLLKLTNSIYPWLGDIIPGMSIAKLIPIDRYMFGMNLAQPEWTILPLIGVAVPILAVIVAITTYVQSKVTTPPATDAQSAQMSGMMTIYMPLLLGYFAINFASGLAVYFVTSNLIGIAQYAFLGKVDWGNLLKLPSLGMPQPPEKGKKK